MADDLLDNSPDDDDTDDGIDLTGGDAGTKAVPPDDDDDDDGADRSATDTTASDTTAPDKPPAKTYTQDDIDRIRAATRKERDTVTKLRRELRELKSAQTTTTGDATDAVAQAREEAAAAELARLKPVAVRAKAEALFAKHQLQNPTDARVARLVRNLDMAEIDIDPVDGSIVGLEEQVEALVEEFAEMFTPPPAAVVEPAKQKPRIPRGDAADRKSAPAGPDKNKDTGAYLAQRILGQTSR